MSKFSNLKLRYKVGVGVATGAAVLSVAGGAFAYFTTTGSGTGTGAVGSSSAMTINQKSIVYSNNGTGQENALVPGTTATITFTVDNPSTGHQLLNKIHLQSWSSDKAGCNGSGDAGAQSSWITMPDVTVNSDYAPGNAQAVTPTGTVTFNNLTTTDQSACKGATLTFNYTSN